MTTGIMIGHFEPLHLGQVRSVIHASGLVDKLVIFVTPHPSPNPKFQISLKDKARWLTMAFAELPFIEVKLLPDSLFPSFDTASFADNGAHNVDALNHNLEAILAQALSDITSNSDCCLFVTADSTLAKVALRLPVKVLPAQIEFDSVAIHANPALHWQAIHPQARGDYSKTIAIVGGESSGKTTLLHKLVNYYGASYALEMGRIFVQTDLGGTELGMQYEDYPLMACDHAQAIRHAKSLAPAPLTLVDTDFVTTQAFCEEYEGKTHPFLASCIDTFKLDYTFLLANNTPWVADGMRSLGSQSQRARFENRLKEIFARHNITLQYIDSADYHERFLQAVTLIDTLIFDKH